VNRRERKRLPEILAAQKLGEAKAEVRKGNIREAERLVAESKRILRGKVK
jgi:hypothetical protein